MGKRCEPARFKHPNWGSALLIRSANVPSAFFRGHILLRSRHGWVCACTMDILILWKLNSKVISDRYAFSTLNYLKALKHSHGREREREWERCSDFSPLTLLRIWHRASSLIPWLPDWIFAEFSLSNWGSLLGTQSWFHESPGSSGITFVAITVKGGQFRCNLHCQSLFCFCLCWLGGVLCGFSSLCGFFDFLASGCCGSVLISSWHILAMKR